jgi:CBS domain-containing protein
MRFVTGTALKSAGLATVPDIWSTYPDGQLRFVLRDESADKPTESPVAGTGLQQTGVAVAGDPTYRLERLQSANIPPVSVAPDAPVELAISLMLKNGFSQLPVMEGPRTLKGIISWTSIAQRQGIGIPIARVRDCTDDAHVLPLETSLFAAIEAIYQCDYALVRHPDNRIGGIVTTADLALEFRSLSEPFLLIGEIENHLRRLITPHFTLQDLQQVKNATDPPREVTAIDDLTFGEYIRLLQVEDNWKRLSLRLDRAQFIKWLEEVRDIRNDVMHFDPDPLSEDEVQSLRDIARLMQRLRRVGAVYRPAQPIDFRLSLSCRFLELIGLRL